MRKGKSGASAIEIWVLLFCLGGATFLMAGSFALYQRASKVYQSEIRSLQAVAAALEKIGSSREARTMLVREDHRVVDLKGMVEPYDFSEGDQLLEIIRAPVSLKVYEWGKNEGKPELLWEVSFPPGMELEEFQ